MQDVYNLFIEYHDYYITTYNTEECERTISYHALRTTFEMQSGYSRRLALAELRFDANLHWIPKKKI